MSWMDSWSRPTKSQATPAPLYLVPGGEHTPYCKSCGRVIGTRKVAETASTSTPARYCSSRCRSQKPGPIDREIERAFVMFLSGEKELPLAQCGKAGQKTSKKTRGDGRILVFCDAVEQHVFGERPGRDPWAPRGELGISQLEPGTCESGGDHRLVQPVFVRSDKPTKEPDVWDLNDGHEHASDGHRLAALAVRSGTRVRPPQESSEVNGSVGGEKGWAERTGESEEMLEKRLQGQRRAKEREMVRCAARRGVVFGFVVKDTGNGGKEKEKELRRKCEAVMQGKVVEPSYAKGDWGVRWRESESPNR